MTRLAARCLLDVESYRGNQPGEGYLERLLDSDTFVALVALKDRAVIGGLAAHELPKLEQQRSEMYTYDLAVAESHRRMGVATAPIQELKETASAGKVHAIFVQADCGDDAAIALYSKMAKAEQVLHFNLDPL